MKTAHYYASKNTKFVEFGVNGKSIPNATRIAVAGKREANKVAALHNAKPWNF